MAGALKYVSSGTDIVIGVNAADRIYVRQGISRQTPAGTSWASVGGLLKVVDANEADQIWGVNSANNIYHG